MLSNKCCLKIITITKCIFVDILHTLWYSYGLELTATAECPCLNWYNIHGSVIVLKRRELQNASCWMIDNVSGILIESKLWHPANASSSMNRLSWNWNWFQLEAIFGYVLPNNGQWFWNCDWLQFVVFCKSAFVNGSYWVLD